MSPSPFVSNLLLFGRLLRRAGVEVHHNRLIDALRALEWVGVGRRQDVQATLRALLVHRHEDLARFDAAFELFFRARATSSTDLPLFSLGERARVVVRALPSVALSAELEDLDPASSSATPRAVGAYSAAAVSRTKDFADFTPAEIDQARRLLAHLPWQLGVRRTRRWQRAGRTAIDLRPMLRRTVTDGEILKLTFRRRRTAPRPIVVLGDVSGSMERYSRILLHFVYGLARQAGRVESFLFATSLTRITPRLAATGSARELTRVVRRVTDWGGGTRIGEAVGAFNRHWARRAMRHGPVVLIVSDGWDRGDPAVLAREIARLRRRCRRLIWLNPLLGSADYEPLTRGMQAALPYIDDFLPAHNMASLEQLAARLGLAR